MTKPLPPNLTPREREIVLHYRNLDLTVAEVRKIANATPDRVYAALRKAREPFRRSASAKPGRVARRGTGLSRAELLGIVGDASRSSSGEAIVARLERLMEARIADLEDRTAPGRGADPEIAAKALALNVRTLATLRRLSSGEADDPTDLSDSPPRSLSDLRDELRGHLQRIRIEGRARRGLAEAGPEPE